MVVGNEKTAVGIVLYSDKTHGLQGMKCYPLYSELMLVLTVVFLLYFPIALQQKLNIQIHEFQGFELRIQYTITELCSISTPYFTGH